VLTRHGLGRTTAAVVPAPFFVAEILASTDLACIIMRNFAPRDDRLLPLPFPSKVHPFGQFSHARDDDNPLILWLRQVMREVVATCLVSDMPANLRTVDDAAVS